MSENRTDPVTRLAAERDEAHDTGGELILEEAREEVVRLVTHPVTEVRRLEHVAEEGDSAATPLIVAIGVGLFIAVVLAIALTVIMLVYYTA